MSDPNFFLSRLNGEPHALAFGGQSTPWPVALADLTNDPALEATLRGHVAAANTMLAPVAADLLATTGRAVDLFGFKPNPARLGAAAAATVSVEGIALTQLGALIDAAGLGLDVANPAPVAVLGHSQGVLGAHMVNVIRKAGSIEAAGQQIDEILAIAELIGVAGTRKARELALTAQHAGATPMLSVRGATKRQVEVLASRVPNPRGPISIAVTNSSNNHVLSGYPEDLAAFEVEAGKEHKRQQTLRDEKVRGGAVFGPVLEYLEVTLPFHSPLMADAVEQAVAWAHACGFKETRTRELAAEVLLNHVDWAARVKAMLESCDPSKLWIVDFGPGNTLGKLIGNLIQGTGVGVVEATTMAERSALSTMEDEPVRTQNWKTFAPKVLHTPAGDKIRTKFTDLTGKPPVLLPGMTPTTVDPEIVADRRRVRPSCRRAGEPARRRPHGRIQRDVHGSLPLEPAVRPLRHRAEEARVRHADRRRDRLGRHPRARRGQGARRLPAGGRPALRRLQARHRRADPPGRGDCQGRGPHDDPDAGRRRFGRRPPLLGVAG